MRKPREKGVQTPHRLLDARVEPLVPTGLALLGRLAVEE